MKCLLCQSTTSLRAKDVFECSQCGLVFKNPQSYYDSEKDFKRYETHNNSGLDLGYVNFLNRLVEPVMNFLPKSFTGLDFGCGPGPTLSKLLIDKGGIIENYDPLFFKNDEALKHKYDLVTCSEVVEHFKKINEDWDLLISLIKPNGILGVMTNLIDPSMDYAAWWYKNDPTHVVFYTELTLDFLAKKYQLEILFCDKKSVIIFKKL